MEFLCIPEFQILNAEHFGSSKKKKNSYEAPKSEKSTINQPECLNVAKQHTPIAP